MYRSSHTKHAPSASYWPHLNTRRKKTKKNKVVAGKQVLKQRSITYLDTHADSALAAAPGHGFRRAQPPNPGREPPHRHLPRLGLPRPRSVPRFVGGASPLPPLTTPAAAHVPFQQRRRGPAPPPAAGRARRRLNRPPFQAPRRPERRRRGRGSA